MDNNSKANPLKISKIVERTLRFLPDDKVQKCRQVCKMWKKAGDQVLESRDSVTITSDQDIKDVLERYKNDSYYWVSKLSLQHYPKEATLITNLMLKVKSQLSKFDCICGRISQRKYEDLMRILVGENIVDLTVGNLTSSGSNRLNRLIQYFPVRDSETGELITFPNVKFLEYNQRLYIDSNRSLLSSVAKMFPNLVRLEAYDVPSEKLSNFDQIQFPHLRYLRIHQKLNDEEKYFENNEPGLTETNVQCLHELKLNLKELIIENVNRNLDPEILKEFLESQMELEKLKLRQYSFKSHKVNGDPFCRLPAPCPFPCSLPSLKTLDLDKSFVQNLNHVFASCPGAKKIIFRFHENADWTSILSDRKLKPPATLKTLDIYSIDPCNFKKIGLSVLSKQITQLDLYNCNDALLRIVFEKFVNLKGLFLWDKTGMKAEDLKLDEHSIMTDGGFSGLTPKTLGKVQRQKERSKMDGTWKLNIGKRFDRKRIHPHIGNLKQLEFIMIHLSPLTSIKLIPFWGIHNLAQLVGFIFKGKKIEGLIDFMKDGGFEIHARADLDGNEGNYCFQKI